MSATPLRGASTEEGIQIAELFLLDEPDKTKLAAQIGITHAIVKVLPDLTGMPRTQYRDFLARVRSDLEASGLEFAGVESHPVPAEKIKLGLPGRDEEIENYIAVIRALGDMNAEGSRGLPGRPRTGDAVGRNAREARRESTYSCRVRYRSG